jgi:DNA-binding XRE family transcriptional regulator
LTTQYDNLANDGLLYITPILMLTNDVILYKVLRNGYRSMSGMKRKTNFDQYLEEKLKNEDFADRFKKAGAAWDVALKLVSLRKESGLSQKELAQRAGTTQQQISRLESPSYEGHSLSMLRRVAEVLGATVRIELNRGRQQKRAGVAEYRTDYKGNNIRK